MGTPPSTYSMTVNIATMSLCRAIVPHSGSLHFIVNSVGFEGATISTRIVLPERTPSLIPSSGIQIPCGIFPVFVNSNVTVSPDFIVITSGVHAQSVTSILMIAFLITAFGTTADSDAGAFSGVDADVTGGGAHPPPRALNDSATIKNKNIVLFIMLFYQPLVGFVRQVMLGSMNIRRGNLGCFQVC